MRKKIFDFMRKNLKNIIEFPLTRLCILTVSYTKLINESEIQLYYKECKQGLS